MLQEELRQLKTGKTDLRKFGLLVGAVFAALGILFLLRGRAAAPYLLAPGLFLLVFGAALPRLLKPIYIGWMSIAILLGFVVSHLILFIFFFAVITPVGMLARLFGKDFLRLKTDNKASTYWVWRESRRKSPGEYERQF